MLATKFRDDVKLHIDAGHFQIYPKAWMGQRRIWIWAKPDGTIGNACATQREAEDEAVAWYTEINPSV